MAADGSIFFADELNHRIRRITPDGVIRTYAGTGDNQNFGDDGPALRAGVPSPQYIALDRAGTLYVSDRNAHTVRAIGTDGIIRRFAGSTQGFRGDGGPAAQAALSAPWGIGADAQGNLYISDTGNRRIRKVSTDGTILTVAGNGRGTTTETAPGLESGLGVPSSLAVATDGSVFFAEPWEERVRVLRPDGSVAVYAGGPRSAGLDGPAVFARVDGPSPMAFDAEGNTYISDYGAVVRKVDVNGRLTHFAGSPSSPIRFGASEPAASAGLGWVVSMAMARDGRLIVLDGYGRVLSIRDGTVSHVAGNGQAGFSGDGGPAVDAQFQSPQDVAVDTEGNIFVADEGNFRIRRISPDGVISTYAGGGTSTADNQPATAIAIRPTGVAITRKGDLLIAEWLNHRIRGVAKTTGTITTVFGDGTCTWDALNLGRICWPRKVAVGRADEIYVGGGRVSRISPGRREILGKTGWVPSTFDDAPQSFTSSADPIAVTPDGDVVFSTWHDNKVWKVQGNRPFVATPHGMGFTYALSAPAARQSIQLESGDGTDKDFIVSSNVAWLSATPASGVLRANAGLGIVVTADPRGLAKGTYTGRLTIREPGDASTALDVPVTMTVSGTPQQLRLSQTGLAILAVEGTTATRSLQVINTGTGTMAWRAAVQTLSGGNWLQTASAAGSSETGGPPSELRLTVSSAGLAPGVYFGLVTVTAPGADNSPQSATIVLSVTRRDQPPAPLVEPAGLLFTSQQNTPAPQSVQVANTTSSEITYSTTLSFPEGTPQWAALSGPGGRLIAGASSSVEVRAAGSLAAGIYRGELRITISGDSSPRIVSLVLVSAGASRDARVERSANGCEPKRLITVFVSPTAMFQTTAGWPTTVVIRVVNDCAEPLTDGEVAVSFSNGDAPVRLFSEGGGRWSGTWAARTTNNRVTVTAVVRSVTPFLEGRERLDVGVRADQERPVISPAGIRSLASFQEGRPVAAGSPVAILGARLTPQTLAAVTFPLPTELGGTSGFVGGKNLRLRYVADERIEAVLPSGIADSTPLQLIVRRGNSYSVPEPLIVSDVEPAVFTASGTGVGQGMVYAVDGDGTRKLADLERPLKSGDRMGILCVGLGPVDRPVEDGVPAPESSSPRVLRDVTVQVQGRSAEVMRSMLAPGMVGVYWIEAVVPADLKAEANSDVVVRIGERESPAVAAAFAGN
jgi:uncharacterized protein (TIGR03437 family)